MPTNAFNQEIGFPVPDFTPGQAPAISQLIGDYAIVEPISMADHLDDAYAFYGPSSPEEQWTYFPLEAFDNKQSFSDYFETMAQSQDPYYLAIKDKASGRVLGTFALMRTDKNNRVIEMGWVLYGSELKHSRVATEAQFLVMQYVFEVLNYRRYEWKCDSLNEPSGKAAQRLGFQFEGTFRRAIVYKGRNRDTNWYSMIEEDYQNMKPKFQSWLKPDNFDETGKQILSLQDF